MDHGGNALLKMHPHYYWFHLAKHGHFESIVAKVGGKENVYYQALTQPISGIIMLWHGEFIIISVKT